ncbi:uncharacterized protein BDZ83DRAFT_237369 [Colletotrichum acutatum]|uniref:Uncharacterized protein n=1 Tax=Glomerella acutata TaxID=27357 RepID=A0AAD8XGX5_GLOAC|nr:uncharacterized protein BDZ83DRAFT_237369 [Colletotrichum acutatum]KAK1726822.1 hypothetical protein BDZ83DRAFT_237369 [Colletotrichum acutatum]
MPTRHKACTNHKKHPSQSEEQHHQKTWMIPASQGNSINHPTKKRLKNIRRTGSNHVCKYTSIISSHFTRVNPSEWFSTAHIVQRISPSLKALDLSKIQGPKR